LIRILILNHEGHAAHEENSEKGMLIGEALLKPIGSAASLNGDLYSPFELRALRGLTNLIGKR
jgi:hypothetical protein